MACTALETMWSRGVACNKELWAEIENPFQSLEDQEEIVMAVEGYDTTYSLEKQLRYQERKRYKLY